MRLAFYSPEVVVKIQAKKKTGLSLSIGIANRDITPAEAKTIVKGFEEGLIVETSLGAFLEYYSKKGIDFDIFIIPPIGKFKKFKPAIIVFPISYIFTDKMGREYIGYIRKNVLFKNKLYDHTEFIGDNELMNTDEMLAHINSELIYTLPFFLAAMPYDNFLALKKVVLTPLRSFLYRMGIVSDYRGKKYRNPEIRLRNQTILNEYKRLGKPKRNPIKRIHYKLQKKADKLFADNNDKLSEYYCSDTTIWRVLKSFQKK